MTKERFRQELGGVNQYMCHHFRMRWGSDEELYMSAIERSMASNSHFASRSDTIRL